MKDLTNDLGLCALPPCQTVFSHWLFLEYCSLLLKICFCSGGFFLPVQKYCFLLKEYKEHGDLIKVNEGFSLYVYISGDVGGGKCVFLCLDYRNTHPLP